MHISTVLQVLFALASRLGWLVLILLVLVKGEIRLYHLVGGVGLAHLPTQVLLMGGAQWKLCDWTEGIDVPLRARTQFCHTFLLAWLLVFLLFLAKHRSGLQ